MEGNGKTFRKDTYELDSLVDKPVVVTWFNIVWIYFSLRSQ